METIAVILLLGLIVYLFILKPYFIKPFREGLNSESKKPAIKKEAPKQEPKIEKEAFNTNSNADTQTPQEKGKLFEEFVVKRFKSESFYKLKEWRGDKYVDGIYPESSTYPDLELEFNLKDIRRRFAIECKFRSKAYDGFVEFADQRQLTTYKNFEYTNRIPVYILLGFGGKPEDPQELYLIPVSILNYPYLSLNDLRHFSKDKTSPFYYNLLDETLH